MVIVQQKQSIAIKSTFDKERSQLGKGTDIHFG